MLTATGGTPMNRSELKQEASEWLLLGILLFLGLLVVVQYIVRR